MAVMGARPARTMPLGIPAVARGAGRRRAPGVRAPGRTAVRHIGAGRRAGQANGITSALIVIAAAACLALFYLSQSTHVAATGYQVDELEAQLSDVLAVRQQLVLEISEARSPAVIEAEALDRLKLRPIDASRIAFATRPVELAD